MQFNFQEFLHLLTSCIEFFAYELIHEVLNKLHSVSVRPKFHAASLNICLPTFRDNAVFPFAKVDCVGQAAWHK